MCSYKTPQIERIALYQKYWNEAIILFVVPFENVFYAQEIDKLGKKQYYDLNSDFKPIQDIFPRTNSIDLEEYKRLAIHLIHAMKSNGTEAKGNVEP
jgi:hypothetical protein